MSGMNRIKQLLFLSLLISLVGCVSKTDRPYLVINEVMVLNENSYTDDFGEKNAWIEIYNNTTRTHDLSSIFITNDKNNKKKYPVPRGDINTALAPLQHAVFWADGNEWRGTFHLNFKLNPDEDNYIGIYEADGETVIDEIFIPAGTLLADKTFGYEEDGTKYDAEGNYLGRVLERVTPSGNNKVEGENQKVLDIKLNDPWGAMMTLTAMVVVFGGLLSLYFAFWFITSLMRRMMRRKAIRSGAVKVDEMSGEVLAAISAAIHEMRQDEHDIESTILTIEQVKKNYSPWSSKLYNLRQLPK